MNNQKIPYNDKLQVDEDMQSAILGWMLKNYEFCLKCLVALKPHMFGNPDLTEIFESIKEFLDEYKATPSPESLFAFMNTKNNKKHLKAVINDCMAFSVKFNHQFLSDRLSDWVKTSLFLVYTQEAMRFREIGDVGAMEQTVRKFLEKSNESSFKMDSSYRFGSPVEDFIKYYREEAQDGVTTGLSELDKILGGSLRRGEHTLILAATNVGKTTVCINILAHNIMKKKHCLLLTHEGLDIDVANKLRRRMLMKSIPEVLEMIDSKDPVALEKIESVDKRIMEYLTYLQAAKSGGLFIEDVVNTIRIENEKLFAKKGHYYDLVIDDYPGKLFSRLVNHKDFRHGVKYCYDQMQQVALEYKFHAISPVQSNRDGAKKNKYREADEYLSEAEIAEAYGIAQDASNLLGVNRSVKDGFKNRMFINIIKTRQGPTNDVIQCNTDFPRMISHDECLGAALQPRAGERPQVDVVQKVLGDKYGRDKKGSSDN